MPPLFSLVRLEPDGCPLLVVSTWSHAPGRGFGFVVELPENQHAWYPANDAGVCVEYELAKGAS